jgi:O-antigen/teichoic acid export membrane protein
MTSPKNPQESSPRQASVQHLLPSVRWAAVIQFSAQIFSWLSTLIVVRFVSPDDFGLYSMLEAPMELLLLFGLLGMDVALVRESNIAVQAQRGAFGLLLLVGLALFSCFFFGAQYLADYYRQNRLVSATQVLSIVFLIMPFRVIPNALMDKELKFKSRAQLEFISKVVSAICTLMLAFFGAGYWSLVAGLLVERILYAVIVQISHPWIIVPSFRFWEASRLIQVGGYSTASSGLQLVTSKGVGILAAPLLGAAAMGAYSLATFLALLPLSKAMPIFSQVLVPVFAAGSTDREAVARQLTKAIRIALGFLAPVMLGLAALSEPLIKLVFGPDWASAATPMGIFSCIVPLRLTTQFLRIAITSLSPPQMMLWAIAPSTILVLPLTSVAASHGVSGLILLWSAVEPISLLVAFMICKRVLPLTPRTLVQALAPALVPAVALGVTAMGVSALLPENLSALRLVLGGLAGAGVYFAVLATLYRSTLIDMFSMIRGS